MIEEKTPETRWCDVDAALNAGFALSAKQEIDGTPFLVIPTGYTTGDLSQYLAKPTRIKQSPVFQEKQSFMSYVNRFQEAGTTLWGDQKTRSIKAVLDYHKPDAPKWGDHTATLQLAWSPAFQRWAGLSGKSLSQADFATMLEDCLDDIISPDAGKVLDVVTNLTAHKTAKFSSAINTHNGAHTLSYEEAIEGRGKGQFQVPQILTLNIPIYDGEPASEMKVRLRYRIDNGLTFTLHIIQHEELLRSQFVGVMQDVEQATGLACWLGTRS